MLLRCEKDGMPLTAGFFSRLFLLEAMVDAGLVAEVEALIARGDLHRELPAMRAVGYRQIWDYLGGEYDWAEARRRAVAATRQLAKRQMTWLVCVSISTSYVTPEALRSANPTTW